MELLKKCSKGDSVKLLQELLNKHGFNLTVDGDFGNKTEEAVKQFQKRLNLTVDGIVGSKTFEALQAKYEANINIIKDFLKVHITPKTRTSIKYLVIHFTAGSSSKPGRAKSAKHTFETSQASADFCVDDRDIVQFNPDPYKYYCWAVGDKKYNNTCGGTLYGKATNKNTISIEICSTCIPPTKTAVNTPNHEGWLFTESSLKNVVRHYDISGKLCPGIIGWNKETLYDVETGKPLSTKNTEEKWIEFKNKLK